MPGVTPGVRVDPFGALPNGTPVQLYTLTNRRGHIARISDYGASLTELHLRDRDGAELGQAHTQAGRRVEGG